MSKSKKEPVEQAELGLPYEDISGKIAPQKYAKDNFERGNDILVFKVEFNRIEKWEGYNARTIYDDIPEMADSLFNHGQKTPFKLATLRDGRIFLVRGGRRYAGYELLIEQGKFDPSTKVPFQLTHSYETMEELLIDLHHSNSGRPLHPVDLATVAYRLKYNCGKEKSNDEVAIQLDCSRQKIDNLILIAEAGDDIRNEIRIGKMTFTDAVSFIRRQKADAKIAEDKQQQSLITSDGPVSLPADPLKKELQELEELENSGDDGDAQGDNESEDHFQSDEANTQRQIKEMERIFEYANEVLCNHEDLTAQLGKRLAMDAKAVADASVLDEDTGEVVKAEAHTIIAAKESEVTEDLIKLLVESKVGSVFIYKKHTVSPSVITQTGPDPEKKKYDEGRPEIAWIQNIIKLSDKMTVIVEKLDIPDSVKKGLLEIPQWQLNDAWPLRDWIHSNKKQNKIR